MRTSALFLAFGLTLSLVGAPVAGAQTAPPPGASSGRDVELRLRAEAFTAPYAALIGEHANNAGVDPALIVAVIAVESKGDPNAYSSSGAMGLMQLMPATCEDYGVADPYDPDSNIRGGAALLGRHLARYKGDLQKVLAAYNAGPRKVDDGTWRKLRETQRYVPAVLAYYAALRPGGDGWAPSAVVPPSPVTPAFTGPGFRVLDTMFEAVRSVQAAVEPEGVAENGGLHDVANTVMSEYLSGKLAAKNLQARATKLLAASAKRPKSLNAVCFTTEDVASFADAWAKRPPAPGRFIGLAHGTNRSGHVWLVLLANF